MTNSEKWKRPDALLSARGFTETDLNPQLASVKAEERPLAAATDLTLSAYLERQVDALLPLIGEASEAARLAYLEKLATIGDAGAAGFVDARIDIQPGTKPLIRGLLAMGVGKLSEWHIDCHVGPIGFLHEGDMSVQSIEVQEAGCKAFARVMRDNGFEFCVDSRVD